MAHDRMDTTAELAARLRISPATLRRWALAGRIPAVRIGKRVLRFDAEVVFDALEGQSGTKEAALATH